MTIKKRKTRKAQTASRPVGRPSVMTPETIRKLETAYLMGCSDNEACFSAGIGRSTLADYEAAHPKFSERKRLLKSNPVFLARQAVIEAIKSGDAKTATWLLERKRRNEFGNRTKPETENKTTIEPIDLNDWAQQQNDAFLGRQSQPPEGEAGE